MPFEPTRSWIISIRCMSTNGIGNVSFVPKTVHCVISNVRYVASMLLCCALSFWCVSVSPNYIQFCPRKSHLSMPRSCCNAIPVSPPNSVSVR